MSYTDVMITELKDGSVWDYEKAKVFAAKYKLTPRSVVAKINALGVAYKAKEAKSAQPKADKISKADLVAKVEDKLAVKLPSLSKMNMDDLVLLIEAIEA